MILLFSPFSNSSIHQKASKSVDLILILSYNYDMKTSKKIRIIISAVLFALLFGALIFESAKSSAVSNSMSNSFVASLITNLPFLRPIYNLFSNPSIAFRKIFGHFASFLLLGGLTCWFCKELFATRIKEVIVAIAVCVFTASVIELIQIFPKGRVAIFSDVLLNAYGFLSATFIFDLTAILVSVKGCNFKIEDLKSSLFSICFSLVVIILSIIFPPTLSGTTFCYIFFLVVMLIYSITVFVLYLTTKKSRF